MLDTGNVAIALFETPNLEINEAIDLLSEKGYLHLAFEASSADFGQIVKQLKDKKVKIGNGPVKRGDGKSVYFNDPDQNHLEIHCNHLQ